MISLRAGETFGGELVNQANSTAAQSTKGRIPVLAQSRKQANSSRNVVIRRLRVATIAAIAALVASTASPIAAGHPTQQQQQLARAVAQSQDSSAVTVFQTPQDQTEELVRYQVQFKGTWTTASLAQGVSIPSGAHFTTMVGAAHSSSVTFWESGGTATSGIESVAETGGTSTFRSEVNSAITAKTAREWINVGSGLLTFTRTSSFDVSESFPLVTLISMVAPTPDWFVGVSNLSLHDGSDWVDRKEVDLFPYDAGTEDGSGFSLSNPNTNPRQTITSIRNTGKFSDNRIAQLVFIRQKPPNRAPVFASATTSRSIAENSPASSDIGAAVTATDQDSDALTYTLSGTDAGSFTIVGSTGQLRTSAALNYEQRPSYTVTVTATDPSGDSDSITVTINVTNVDEPGTVMLSSGMPAVGTALSASLTDPDGSLSSTTWAWHYSTDQVSWTAISSSTSASYTPQTSDVGRYLRATASYTDGAGSGKSAQAVSSNQVISTAIPNRAPDFSATTAQRSVAENSPAGAAIGAAIAASDLDGDTLTYSLGGTHAASFAIDSATGQLRTKAALNYESQRTYSVTVTATDPSGDSDSISVTINITNVDEPGTVTLSSGAPEVGTALTARLADLDGSVSSTTWAWHRSTNQVTWTAISSATSATYTPQASDVGRYLRARASYTDGAGSGKSAQAASSNQVISTSTPSSVIQPPSSGGGGGGGGGSVSPSPSRGGGGGGGGRGTTNPPVAAQTPSQPFRSAFVDIIMAVVHTEAIEAIEEAGLIEGTECETSLFCPNQPIQRLVMAVWMVRLLDGADTAPSESPRFADVEAGQKWAPFIERLAELEVTLGCSTEPELRFCPDEPVTRAQMASFIVRALKLPTPQDPADFADVAADNVHAADIAALYAAGITAGCSAEPELRFCPDQQTTRAEMASFVNRARQKLNP